MCDTSRNRDVEVDGVLHSVPQYIHRDHGVRRWCVHVKGQKRTYFRDVTYNNRPSKSLKAACEYAATLPPPPTRPFKHQCGKGKFGGIYPMLRIERRTTICFYVVATAPSRPYHNLAIYIGTANTVTDERYEEALKRAEAWKAERVAEYAALRQQQLSQN